MSEKQNSRTSKTATSTAFGIIGYLITYVFSFVVRTVFILYLGKTYLGLQGLFSSILTFLSLTELGLGSAIMFSIYNPLAKREILKVKALMNFYRKAYKIISAAILIMGLALMPFLDFFIKETPDIPENLNLIYLLFLSNSVLSYLLIYKQSLIRADQNTHIVSLYTNLFTVIRYVFQIVVIVVFKSFIFSLIILIVFTVLGNIALSMKADRMYPWLKEKENNQLEKSDRKNILSKIRAMFLYRIGAFVVIGTDNILISKFIGLDKVGVYSNYLLILTLVKSITGFLTNAITPSVGNLISTSNKDKVKRIFFEIDFMIFGIYSLCSLLILFLITPFITIWIGAEYTFSFDITFILVINFYLYGMHQNMLIFRNALGLYEKAKMKPVFEALINLVVSLVLVKHLGILGIFLGTTISFLTTALWIEPRVLYKEYFKESTIEYFKIYGINVLITVTSGIIIWKLTSLFNMNVYLESFITLILVVFIHVSLVLVVFSKTKRLKDFVNRIKHIIPNLLNRKEKNYDN